MEPTSRSFCTILARWRAADSAASPTGTPAETDAADNLKTMRRVFAAYEAARLVKSFVLEHDMDGPCVAIRGIGRMEPRRLAVSAGRYQAKW